MNVTKALDEHLVADLEAAQDEADVALERYVDAMRRVSELQALIDLRRAMGGNVRPSETPSIKLEASA